MQATDINTHFSFRHKVFSVEGCYFATGRDSGEPFFATPLGDSMALVKIPALRTEFSIAAESDDGKLLDIVERSLKFVSVIRVNDAIPNELLDGSASWTVDDRHRLVGRARLTVRLLALVTGKEAKDIDLGTILKELEAPETKEKVKESVDKIAVSAGLSDNGAEEIERRIETLVHELSFIEGLRERLIAIQDIETRSKDVIAACSKRFSVRESAERVPVLLTYAIQKLSSEFEVLDKQSQNIAGFLRDVESTVLLIREIRDELHCELKKWDDLIAAWDSHRLKSDVEHLSNLLNQTHRFLVENYPIMHVW